MYHDEESQAENVIAGRIDCIQNDHYAKLEVENGLTVTSTGIVAVSNEAELNVYGGMTVEAGGQVMCEMGEILFSGASSNSGTITVNGGSLTMWNAGYSVTNSGTIAISSDSLLNIRGTVLVNTGTLTGGGSLDAGKLDATNSYDNGIEWVTINAGDVMSPSNYNHYEFVRDPADTVDVIYFQGKLSNVSGGTSDLNALN